VLKKKNFFQHCNHLNTMLKFEHFQICQDTAVESLNLIIISKIIISTFLTWYLYQDYVNICCQNTTLEFRSSIWRLWVEKSIHVVLVCTQHLVVILFLEVKRATQRMMHLENLPKFCQSVKVTTHKWKRPCN